MRTFIVFESKEDEGYIAHEENHPNISGFGETKERALEESKIAWEMFELERVKDE